MSDYIATLDTFSDIADPREYNRVVSIYTDVIGPYTGVDFWSE